MAKTKAPEPQGLQDQPQPEIWEEEEEEEEVATAAAAAPASSEDQLVPTTRPQYLSRQSDRENSAPTTEMPRERKRGLLARLRFGNEINEHEITMMRGTHLVIEGQAHAEGAAVTAVRGVQLRGQMADRIGRLAHGYGEDSAAWGVMPGIAQEGFEEGDEAISAINRQTYESLKRNQRMIK